MVSSNVLISLILSSLLLGGIYILISLGMSLIFGVMDIINFAHGGFVMIGGYVVLVAATYWNVHPAIGFLLVIPVMFAVGYAIQYALLENVLEDLHMNSLLLTFGVAIMIEAGLTELFGNQARFVSFFDASLPFGLGMAKILSGVGGYVGAALLFLLLYQTELGQAIRATAQVPELAKASGIDVTRVRTITFGIGSVLAGLGGAFYLLPYDVSPIGGRYILLLAFIIVVLGGMGSLKGAAIAGVIVSTIQVFVGYYFTSSGAFTLLFFGSVLLLLVRPQGLYGDDVEVAA